MAGRNRAPSGSSDSTVPGRPHHATSWPRPASTAATGTVGFTCPANGGTTNRNRATGQPTCWIQARARSRTRADCSVSSEWLQSGTISSSHEDTLASSSRARSKMSDSLPYMA